MLSYCKFFLVYKFIERALGGIKLRLFEAPR